MAVNYHPDKEHFVSDQVTIRKWAEDEAERREALRQCIERHWRNKDLGCIERVENANRWGWKMYPYRAGDTGPPANL